MNLLKLRNLAAWFFCASSFALPVSVQASTKVLGVGVHSLGVSAGEQDRQLDLAQQAGLVSVRSDAPWKYVEPIKGALSVPAAWDRFVDEAVKRGLKPVLILDYGNPAYDGGDKPRSDTAIEGFTNYAEFVVRHFRGQVDTFEIWNEWDNHTGGFPDGSPDDYARMFKHVYPVLKKAFPDTRFLVGSGVKSGWYERLAQLGVIAQGDGVSVHPYNYQKGSLLGPEDVAQSVIALEERLSRMTDKPRIDLYVTEIGWPTNTGRYGAPEDVVGNFAPRLAALLVSLPYVRGIWWYDLVDDGSNASDKEARFGLVRQNHSLKPAYLALASIVPTIRENDLSLSDRSELDRGFVVISLTASTDRRPGFLVWNAGSGAASIRVECEQMQKASAVQHRDAALHVTSQPNLLFVSDGQCDLRSLDAGKGK